MQLKVKGLLLAGGWGTRLRPLTYTGNKHMLPIANQPMIMYGLNHLIQAGVREIAIILGPMKEGIVEYLGDGSKLGAKLTYIEQEEPKGLSHAVLCAKDYLKDSPFVMYLGDNLLKQGAKPFLESYATGKWDCIIGVTKVKDPSRYGVVEMDGNKIKTFKEKPKEPKSNLALIGVYVFNNKIFDSISRIKPSKRGELEITDAIQDLLDSGARIKIENVNGWWKDTGKPDDLLEANQLVLSDIEGSSQGLIEDGVQQTGKMSIGKGTIIRANASLRGPVKIGNNCEIGPGVYVGPYTSIGDNSKILSGEIENSLIMNNVTIRTEKRIVDSIIGNNTTIIDTKAVLPKATKLIVGENTFVAI